MANYPINVMSNQVSNQMAGMMGSRANQRPQSGPPRRISRVHRAIVELTKAPSRDLPDEVRPYYRSVSSDTIIHELGFVRPVRCGRPHHLARRLLELAAGDVPHMYYQNCGLTYMVPFIPGRAKTKSRLTINGLKLLDYWAEKSPAFRPFVAAYVTKKARQVILQDCIDFELGVVPLRIKDMLEKQKAAYADMQRKEMLKLDEYIRMKQMEHQKRKSEMDANKRWLDAMSTAQQHGPLWITNTNVSTAAPPNLLLGNQQAMGTGSIRIVNNTATVQTAAGTKSYPNVAAIQQSLPNMYVSYSSVTDKIHISSKWGGVDRVLDADLFR